MQGYITPAAWQASCLLLALAVCTTYGVPAVATDPQQAPIPTLAVYSVSHHSQKDASILQLLDYPVNQLVLFSPTVNARYGTAKGQEYAAEKVGRVAKLQVYKQPLHIYKAWLIVLEKHPSDWYVFAAMVTAFLPGALASVQARMSDAAAPRTVAPLTNSLDSRCSFQAFTAHHQALSDMGLEDVVSSQAQLEVREHACMRAGGAGHGRARQPLALVGQGAAPQGVIACVRSC